MFRPIPVERLNSYPRLHITCFCMCRSGDIAEIPDYIVDEANRLSEESPVINGCQKMYLLENVAHFQKLQAGFFIAMGNTCFRYLIIFIIKNIGFSTQTEEMQKVKAGVFIISFFNSAFLVLLMNAEVWLLKGKYNDFSSDWYQSTGSIIISSMAFTAVYPVIEYAGFGFLRYVHKARDQGRWCPRSIPTRTKCKSISEYYELYSGERYEIHWKYATIQNLVLVCFLFGAGIPLLFPIGLVGLILLYVTERYKLAVYYRLPPNFAERLNLQCIQVIEYAPMLYSLFGFWMYSNEQLFNSQTYPLEKSDTLMPTGHTILGSLTTLTPGFPFLILFVISVYFKFRREKMIDRIIHGKLNQDMITISPNNESFFSAVPQNEKEWLRDEEDFIRKNYGMSILPESKIEQMMKTPAGSKLIFRQPFYDILSNINYRIQFQFTSVQE